MIKLNKLTKGLVLACTLSMLFTGCSAKKSDSQTAPEENNTPNVEQEATDSSETITITDAKGEVTIPANPTRIVDISGNSDILSILGYSVIGTANSDAYDYTKVPVYLNDILKDAKILGYSMQDTMDVEGIIALEPDLIIMSSVQEKMYAQLSEIAPTVMITLAQTDWKEDVNAVANIMDKEEEASEWLAAYKEKAEAIGAQVKETYGEDTTYLCFLASGGQIFIFDQAGLGSILYEDMGLARPANLPEQDSISLPVVSYEGLAAIDADFILAIGTDDDFASLHDSAIYNSMDAVKNGNVIELPSSPYFNQGYSSIGRNLFLDEFIGLMEQ